MNVEVTKSSKGLQVYMGGGFSSLTPEQAENVAKIPQIERDVTNLKERFDQLPEGGSVTKEELSNYYTKTESDNRYAFKGETTSSGGGISSESADLLCDILGEALYGSVQIANIELLRTKLKSSAPAPTKTLASITATYSGGSVPVGLAVSNLTGIVVTAHYSDGSTQNVTGYTLSGTIAKGTNTVTVSYGGKTTTISVTGVE